MANLLRKGMSSLRQLNLLDCAHTCGPHHMCLCQGRRSLCSRPDLWFPIGSRPLGLCSPSQSLTLVQKDSNQLLYGQPNYWRPWLTFEGLSWLLNRRPSASERKPVSAVLFANGFLAAKWSTKTFFARNVGCYPDEEGLSSREALVLIACPRRRH